MRFDFVVDYTIMLYYYQIEVRVSAVAFKHGLQRPSGIYRLDFQFRLSSFDKRIKFRKARVDKFELDEGFQPYHTPLRVALASRAGSRRARVSRLMAIIIIIIIVTIMIMIIIIIPITMIAKQLITNILIYTTPRGGGRLGRAPGRGLWRLIGDYII